MQISCSIMSKTRIWDYTEGVYQNTLATSSFDFIRYTVTLGLNETK